MATKRIDQLPAAAAVATHELPAMVGGVTSKVTAASLALANDPASDGAEYVRVNGAWRQVGQTFPISGVATLIITAPLTARACRVTGILWTTTFVTMRVSADGSTFHSGASHYNDTGTTTNSGTDGEQLYVPSAAAYSVATASADNSLLPQQIDTSAQLSRPSTSVLFAGTHRSTSDDNAATALARLYQVRWYLASAATTSLTLKAIRFNNGSASSPNFGSGSYLDVRWIY